MFNDRVKYGDDKEESELYYKQLLLEHGAYLLFNTDTSNVCAAGVVDNWFDFYSTPWSKINVIACYKFGKGYGNFLMKHMVDAADGQKIFVYAVTDIKETTLKIANKYNGKDKFKEINRKYTVPFYKKYGFAISKDFKQNH